MAKDPAFLFYPGDWLGGTIGMSFEEKGAYIDLLMLQFNRGAFSEKTALVVLRDNPSTWGIVKTKFSIDEQGLYYNERLKIEKEKRVSYTQSRRESRAKSDEDNVRLYIVRDNVRGYVKIGSSVNPLRRYNELCNQENPAIMHDKQGERNITLIWYSEPVVRTEEKRLHVLYSTKRVSGEWFSLLESDINDIKNTYPSPNEFSRTSPRTENENEDENINKDLNEIKKVNKKANKKGVYDRSKLEFPWSSDLFMKAWDSWLECKRDQWDFVYASVNSEQVALHGLLKKSGGSEQVALQIISNSIENGWKGLFGLGEKQVKTQQTQADTYSKVLKVALGNG